VLRSRREVAVTTSENRGVPVGRIEALSDGVFAIALTVLVLNIQIPESDPAGPAELAAKLALLWPKFASYVMSFIMLGVLWIGHHFQFIYVRRSDRILLWINLLFLLAITFLPFATGVLANYYRVPLAVLLYGGTLFVAGTTLLGHWIYATRERHLVRGDTPAEVIASIRRRLLFGLSVYVSATAAGWIDTRISIAMFVLMPLFYLVPTGVDRHIKRS
jgi:uncharacterized membrane protein